MTEIDISYIVQTKMYFNTFYSLISALLSVKSFTYAMQLNTYFRLLENAANLGEPFQISGTSSESLLECVMHCPITFGCYAVNYSFEEKTCHLYNWEKILLQETPSLPQSALVVNTGVPMFHVTGRALLTFDEAEKLCGKFGATLASVSQMYDARDQGYDLCRCGWVSDESIRFVIQTQRPECDSYDRGVISCKELTSSTDVYCTFA